MEVEGVNIVSVHLLDDKFILLLHLTLISISTEYCNCVSKLCIAMQTFLSIFISNSIVEMRALVGLSITDMFPFVYATKNCCHIKKKDLLTNKEINSRI